MPSKIAASGDRQLLGELNTGFFKSPESFLTILTSTESSEALVAVRVIFPL